MGGVSTPELAAAVSGAGGLGMLGAAAAPLAARLDALHALGGGPYGVNFLGPFLDHGELDMAAGRVRLVELFWLTPDSHLVERIHREGALAGWQVGSVEEAKAAADAGADIVVAQGVEAGGHVRGTVSLLPLLCAVLDAVGHEVVVVASGGIGSARSMAGALAAGADAVRVGSRFVASDESNAHAEYKAALVAAGIGDTVINEEFGRQTGWPDAPNRVLRSALDAANAFDGNVVASLRVSDTAEPIAIERFSTMPPTDDCEGNIAAMALYAGESVASIDRIQPAAAIVRELTEGATTLLRDAGSR
jgi:NAD(P)H-dependent flavin oxidoreductase YrpB (nitropropane dioxygenase family)